MKKSILIFIVLSTLASAVNYATYPLLGRILPASEYISITISLSLLTQITTFLSSIVAITIGLSKSSNLDDTNDKVQILQSSLFKLFLILNIFFLLLSPLFMGYIHTPLVFALPISLMMIVSVPIAIVSGFLNGKGLMAKLGVMTVISASFQFTGGAITAYITHSGFLSLLIMALTQAGSIALIYMIFSKDKLPKIFNALRQPHLAHQRAYISRLLIYTLCASLAIMAMNLVQIADLLIVQTLRNSDIKFYTDIYVISRIVFFAGMIFIWPFLGEINIDEHKPNRKPFVKVAIVFTAITLCSTIGLYFFGSFIARLLFGVDYSLQTIQNIGLLSILYKFFFLIVTAATLYFVVLRRYMAVWLALGISGLIFIYASLVDRDMSTYGVLISLNYIAGLAAIISIILVLFLPVKNNQG